MAMSRRTALRLTGARCNPTAVISRLAIVGVWKVKIRFLALGLLLATTSAFAADIDGKWVGSIDSPQGAMMINYTFKSEGNTFTGTTAAPDGSELPIKDGKIEGNKVSFTLTLDFGQGPTTFVYTGEVSATDLKLHTSFMDMPIDFNLKKS
jgi:hypothetical protein